MSRRRDELDALGLGIIFDDSRASSLLPVSLRPPPSNVAGAAFHCCPGCSSDVRPSDRCDWCPLEAQPLELGRLRQLVLRILRIDARRRVSSAPPPPPRMDGAFARVRAAFRSAARARFNLLTRKA